MDAKGRGGVRTSRAGGRAPWRLRVVVLVVLVAAVAIPFNAAAASAPSVSASGPVVKVGMITALTGPLASNPDTKDALLASLAAFNKRGGVGTTHAKLQADVCDSRGDANGEVDVRAPDGRRRCRRDAQRPHVQQPGRGGRRPRGRRDPADRSAAEPTSPSSSRPFSFPVSAGAIAAYLGNAVGFKQDGNTKICLMRTDAPTGATFKGFLAPSFTAIGIDIACDVSVATGATDYAPYIAQLQQENPDAVLISHTDSVTTQLIAAMAQLNAKIPLGGNPGSFTLATLRKYPAITKGTVLSDSFPYPSQANAKSFPGLKQYFADMKASGKSGLSAGEAEDPGLLRLDRHARVRGRDQESRLVHARDRCRGAARARRTSISWG